MSEIHHIRIAVAIARACRWIGAAALAITVALLLGLFTGRPAPTPAAVALCLAILSGVAATYLMMRVELDRTIFEAASDADPNAYFAAFDQSRSQLQLGTPPRDARPVAERVQGLIRLVRTTGYLLILQVIFALAGFWMSRWPF